MLLRHLFEHSAPVSTTSSSCRDRIRHPGHLATGRQLGRCCDELDGRQPGERLFYLTDAAVPGRIATAALDEALFRQTEVSIADIQAISYMKVEARLEPQGLWITPEGLNVPGQRFTGTVGVPMPASGRRIV